MEKENIKKFEDVIKQIWASVGNNSKDGDAVTLKICAETMLVLTEAQLNLDSFKN